MALSPQDFAKLKAQLSGTPIPTTVPTTPVVPVTVTPGFGERVATDLSKRGDTLDSVLSSDRHPALKGLDIVGQGAGFVGDIIGEGVKSGVGALPETIKEPVKQSSTWVLSTPVGKAGITAIQKGAEAFNQFKAQNPEAGQALEDVFNIAAIFPAAGGAKLAGTGVNAVANIAGTGVKKGIEGIVGGTKKVVGTGVNTLDNVLSPIEKGTETVFNPTRIIPKENLKNIPIENLTAQAEAKGAKLDNYVKISENAKVDYSKPTALVKAGDKGTEALNILQNRLTKQAQLKSEALGAVGNKVVPNIGSIRKDLRDSLRERVGVNLVVKDGKLQIENATGRISKVAFDPADNKLMTDSYRLFRKLGDTPTVRQIDDAVDALQDLLYKRKSSVAVPINSQVEGVLKTITGKLNSSVKKVAGEQYAKANAKYAYYIDTFDKLNKALGDEGVRGAQLMKQLFSPSGEAPRRLFKEIKDLTGVDLVEEATLAKYAMESVGDARQASLLEEIIKNGSVTPSSFIKTAAKFIVDKTQNPVKRAKKVIRDIPK